MIDVIESEWKGISQKLFIILDNLSKTSSHVRTFKSDVQTIVSIQHNLEIALK